MARILNLSIAEAAPGKTAVLENQGIPAGQAVSERIDRIYEAACDLLERVALPAGILAEISIPEFAEVYAGEGRNEPETPVGEIFGRADHLALFAVTLGGEVSREIERRFEANDLALGTMLDSAASVAADNLAEAAERHYIEMLEDGDLVTPETGVLRYSPGYCGWHVSGQRRLFAYLVPERIGIALGESYLMQPLKSVSGVIIAGPRTIHGFRDSYPFCDQCETRGCRERLRALFAGREASSDQEGA
jgi:hypothetical protein